MLLAGGERRIALPAVLLRHPRHLVHAADVHDCRECALLLILVRHAVRDGLYRHAVSLADFEVGSRLLIVGSHCDGMPRPIDALLRRHAAAPSA